MINGRELKLYTRKYLITYKKKIMQEQRNKKDIQKTKGKKAGINPTLTVITLNVNELNIPIKMYVYAE